jgi:hypothetical protein
LKREASLEKKKKRKPIIMPSNLPVQVPVTASKVALAATATIAGAFFAPPGEGVWQATTG